MDAIFQDIGHCKIDTTSEIHIIGILHEGGDIAASNSAHKKNYMVTRYQCENFESSCNPAMLFCLFKLLKYVGIFILAPPEYMSEIMQLEDFPFVTHELLKFTWCFVRQTKSTILMIRIFYSMICCLKYKLSKFLTNLHHIVK